MPPRTQPDTCPTYYQHPAILAQPLLPVAVSEGCFERRVGKCPYHAAFALVWCSGSGGMQHARPQRRCGGRIGQAEGQGI